MTVSVNKRVDYFIAVAVSLQPLLSVLQQYLNLIGLPAETTSTYRVILTAVPMVLAMLLCARRRPHLFITAYFAVVFLLLFNILFFPDNAPYLISSSIRFLLPVVLPTVLCIVSLNDMSLLEKALTRLSWVIVAVMVFYMYTFIRGGVTDFYYSMGLSYGLLLPSMTLYMQKGVKSKLASLFLLICILFMGSRGAVIFYILFVLFDIFQRNIRLIIPAALVSVVLLAALPAIISLFASFGYRSRTLYMFANGSISSDSGRSAIYETMTDVLWDHPVFGVGMYGDRVFMDGTYCHNLLLELALDFGIFIASALVVYLVWKTVSTYRKSPKGERMILTKYFLAGVAPLMVSGSYLEDYFLAMFIGVMYTMSPSSKVDKL